MKDKDGFTVRCKHSDWKIIDEKENQDYVCMKFPTYNYKFHCCYGDEYCRYYEPVDIKPAEN